MRRHTARRLTPIAFLAALAGCAPTLAPIPDTSVVTPPVAWRTHLDARGDVERQWWDAFGDPALSQIVADAQANNPDIAIAAARVREDALQAIPRLGLRGEAHGQIQYQRQEARDAGCASVRVL